MFITQIKITCSQGHPVSSVTIAKDGMSVKATINCPVCKNTEIHDLGHRLDIVF